MTTVKRTIACFCENTFEADLPDSVDLAVEPEVADQVIRGQFMEVTCPLCGKRLTPEFPCLFTGVSGNREIFFVPEMDRVAYLRKKLSYDVGSPWRMTIGFAELAEKLRIVGKGLDDRVIEIMKYYLITRPPRESARGADENVKDQGEVTVLFGGEESDGLIFHLCGLREGEIAVARLARDVYAKIEADLEKRVKQDPFKEFCAPPYVSVRRIA